MVGAELIAFVDLWATKIATSPLQKYSSSRACGVEGVLRSLSLSLAPPTAISSRDYRVRQQGTFDMVLTGNMLHVAWMSMSALDYIKSYHRQ